jgi:formylglycine-generating enzyme
MPRSEKGINLDETNPAARPAPGNTHLMAIAIDAYDHCPKLSNCVKDAQDFVALMQERYQVAPERTYTLYDKDATRKRALQELKNLREKIDRTDSLLVFFSGHGEVEDGQAYWVPADGKPGEEEDWISAADIKQRLNVIDSFHTLLIVDACFSGSFFLSFKVGTRKLLGSRPSRLGISASHSRERALDGRTGENSPFAQELLFALRHNPQPLPTDQLFIQVRDAVMQATEGQQTPIFGNINVKGDDQGQFVFVPAAVKDAAWVAIAAMPEETIVEIDAKRAALRSFCRKNPDSAHFDAALRWERRLTRNINSPTQSAVEPRTKAIRLPEMVHVSGGAFRMGGEEHEDEQPIHEIRVSDFYIGRNAVTFEEYDAFCKATGRDKPDDKGWRNRKRPVINVNWHEAVEYCNWQSEVDGLVKVYTISGERVSADWDANGYRLPTEAEWEYAIRGGEAGVKDGYVYAGGNDLDKVGWYWENSGGKPHPVGKKKPNQLGLYDMSGNVWEWCWDWYDAAYYAKSPKENPIGPDNGSARVIRGGSWYSLSPSTCVANRDSNSPSYRSFSLGFRLARSAK